MATTITATVTSVIQKFVGFILTEGLNILYVAGVLAVAAILGAIVAKLVDKAIKLAFKKGRLEERIKAKGLNDALFGFNITQIITVLVKVYIVLAFIGGATQVVNAAFFTNLVNALLSYLASFSQGVAIIVVTMFAAAYITNTIKREQKVLFAKQLALALQIFIGYIALILALPLILPNVSETVTVLSDLLLLLVTAIIAAFGLAVGLSLGLGLKEPVSIAAKKNQQLFDDVFSKIGK